MGTPFMGEIRLSSFNFAPKNWAFCDGQLLPINQNQALFSLLGTTYGGDGVTTFALPDLRGRAAISSGSGNGGNYNLGQRGGEYSHALTTQEMPAHTHGASIGGAANVVSPAGARLAQPGKAAFAPAADSTMAPIGVTPVGGGQPHENTAPYLTLTYIIALQGIFPSRN
ncbi:tail fiber protein [Leifsonia lichenia]